MYVDGPKPQRADQSEREPPQPQIRERRRQADNQSHLQQPKRLRLALLEMTEQNVPDRKDAHHDCDVKPDCSCAPYGYLQISSPLIIRPSKCCLLLAARSFSAPP